MAAPIIGMSRAEQIGDAVKAVEFSLSPDEIVRLEEPYQPVAVQGIDLQMMRTLPWQER